MANANVSRPYQGYATIQEYNTGANFIYNSLQSQFTKRTPGAGIISVAFTWAKGRTDANGYSYQPEDSHNLRGDWGTSNYSRNKVLVGSLGLPASVLAWRRELV